jgi:ribosomal protein S18 acetylase RimI-like enzyme
MTTRPIEPTSGLEPDQHRLSEEEVDVRELRAEDLDRLVRIDSQATGQDRRGYYEKRLKTALEESGIRVSLAAEVDGTVVGYVIGRVYHGEYGRTESFATIDTIGVSPRFRHRGVGHALLTQLRRNLSALRIERVQTEVEWDQWELLRFLQHVGFRPAPRLALELPLE